jgi:hypothetical protein
LRGADGFEPYLLSSTDCLCQYHGRASRDILRVWGFYGDTRGPRYESDLGLRYAPGRGPRDELDLGPRYALGCGPLLPDCGLCNCRTNLSATEPLGVQASGPTPHIGRRCCESPGIGLARYHDSRAAQRVLALPGVIATRGRHSACSSRHDREGPPAAHNMPQGGTQYATMQPHLKKVLQLSRFSSFPSTPNRTDNSAHSTSDIQTRLFSN